MKNAILKIKQEKYVPRYLTAPPLITSEIIYAASVQPCEEVKEAWAEQIIKDVRTDRLSSWRAFLSFITP